MRLSAMRLNLKGMLLSYSQLVLLVRRGIKVECCSNPLFTQGLFAEHVCFF